MARRYRRAKPHVPLTPAQLDAAAQITDADVQHAAAAWEKDAPRAMRGLLEAVAFTPPRKRRPGVADSSA